MKKRTAIYIGILWILLGSGCIHYFNGVEENTPVGNFEALWQIVDSRYCFVDDKNVDWQTVHDTLLPQIKTLDSKDNLRLFDYMAGMLNLLEDGHVNLYSSFDQSRCSKWYEGYPKNFNWEIIKNKYLKNYRYAGGVYYAVLPDDSIGYIYCESFENAVSPSNMYYILTSFKNCKGLILDVRNNGGGDMEYARQLAATFFSESRTVGFWQHKSGPGHQDFSPLREQTIERDAMPSKWFRPVVVLCNRHTYSAANFFASAMRYADNCLLVGGISGGGGGMPMSYELPNGWLVRFSSIRMFDADKKSIEPGITPHVTVTCTSEDRDDIIDRAIKLIHNAK